MPLAPKVAVESTKVETLPPVAVPVSIGRHVIKLFPVSPALNWKQKSSLESQGRHIGEA
jgi:hypothetical protein